MYFLKKASRNFITRWVLPFFDIRKPALLIYLPSYLWQFISYRRLEAKQPVSFRDTYPCLQDKTGNTPFDKHYFYQAAWLARKLYENKPIKHWDIGSQIPMIAVISGFIETVFIDFRPLMADISGLTCESGDITSLELGSDSVASMSSLHVIEHVGLGRYGDPLDTKGSEKAAAELSRVLMPGGRLYVSLPVGKEKVFFNAHRVFSPYTVLELFSSLRLLEFSYVDDKGSFYEAGALDAVYQSDYACGMFMFTK